MELHINDIKHCSNVFDSNLFADDTNLFYTNKNLSALEHTVNTHLDIVSTWLHSPGYDFKLQLVVRLQIGRSGVCGECGATPYLPLLPDPLLPRVVAPVRVPSMGK